MQHKHTIASTCIGRKWSKQSVFRLQVLSDALMWSPSIELCRHDIKSRCSHQSLHSYASLQSYKLCCLKLSMLIERVNNRTGASLAHDMHIEQIYRLRSWHTVDWNEGAAASSYVYESSLLTKASTGKWL